MSSPISVLQAYVAGQSGEGNVCAMADRPAFSFNFSYPYALQGVRGNPYRVHVLWENEDGMLNVRAVALDFQFNPWEGMEEFFAALDGDLQLFARSHFEVNEEYSAPALGLWFDTVGSRIYPTFEVIVTVDDPDDENMLTLIFDQLLGLVGQSLWVCRPVLSYVSSTGTEPDSAERMRLLLQAHGTGEVLRIEGSGEGKGCRRAKRPPPRISFPQGLFGGNIARLRPQ
jgi:hypothetical protein